MSVDPDSLDSELPEQDEDPTLPPLSYRLATITGWENVALPVDDDQQGPFRHLEIVGLSECGNG